MHYEINVSKNGMHFFATNERSLTSEGKYDEALKVFKEKFPKSEGYQISATYYPNRSGTMLDTEIVTPKKKTSVKEIIHSKEYHEIVEGRKWRECFAPTGEDYMQYAGMKFTIVRELIKGEEYDDNEGFTRMYKILLENGKAVTAFNYEVEVFDEATNNGG